MKINSVARKAIADKLASTIKREGLTHKEAAELFGMKSDRVSKFLNDKHRDLISDEYVEPFREWSNSGEKLRVYAKKHNPESVVAASKDYTATARNFSESGPIYKADGGVVNENPGEHVLTKDQQDELRPAHTVKPEWGASIDEIRELLYDWGKSLNNPDVFLATIEETESKDRFDVILAVINEIKEMGFDVDIHISPKTS